MRLTRIEADGLRNLGGVNVELPEGLTLIAGRNGQGKTSLLEAVYLLGTGRSFRTRRADELLDWNGGPLRIVGAVENLAGRSELKVLMDGAERRLVADGAERPLEEFLGRLDVVDLTADRMHVLRGGPEERRRFLDRGVVGLTPSFLSILGRYRKVLSQRNALLRGRFATAELEVWDERLVEAAIELHLRRRKLVEEIVECINDVALVLFPAGEEFQLRYRPSPAAAADRDPSEFGRIFEESLGGGRKRDQDLGYTGVGPHRDDFRLDLAGVDLRKFGSAGQVRAAMVALKLSRLSLLRKAKGETPLFLMDDFDSDLDEIRAGSLAGFLNDGKFQALVATSKEAMADRLGVPFLKVRMRNGAASVG